jgi:hypothetical protein
MALENTTGIQVRKKDIPAEKITTEREEKDRSNDIKIQ